MIPTTEEKETRCLLLTTMTNSDDIDINKLITKITRKTKTIYIAPATTINDLLEYLEKIGIIEKSKSKIKVKNKEILEIMTKECKY